MNTIEHSPFLDVPGTLLGLLYDTWTRTSIRFMLDRYNWGYGATATKLELMHELDLLVQEYNLDRKDRMEILRSYKSGGLTPRRKPRVRRGPRPTFPLSKATHRTITNVLPGHCVVCFESLSSQNRPNRKISSACNHEPDVCRSCLTTSISTQLNSKVWDQIDCPTCGQRLDFHDVKTFADYPTFERSEPRSNLK